MFRAISAICLIAGLSACGGSDSSTTPPPPPPPTTPPTDLPENLARNLRAVTYNPGAGTLSLDVRALDASPLVASYDRDALLDVGDYQGYWMRESDSNRMFVALFQGNAALNVGAVASSGYANRVFGGTYYARVSVYSAPAGGLAVYQGSYVGLISGGDNMTGPQRVTGDAEISADFTNGEVEGQITNRAYVGGVAPAEFITDLALVVTPIAADGTFAGEIEVLGIPDSSLGDFGGIFGGTNASDVAAVLVFTPITGVPNLEYGAILAPRCTSGPPACP